MRPGAARVAGRGATALLLALVATACAGTSSGEGDATLAYGPRKPAQPAPVTTLPRPMAAAPVPTGPGALITPSGVVVPVLSGQAGAWKVTTPCGREATIAEGTHVASTTIVLDAGHGGSDPGATSPSGLAEKGVNLSVSNYTKAALEAAGVPVVLMRTADYDIELSTLAQIAKALSARAMVSIHHNAEPDGPWPGPGSETYYQISSPDSKRLAGLIYEETVRALSVQQVAWVADRDAGAKYRPGRRGDYYAVLRMPAPVVSVLVELAFISNPAEAELLAQAEFQRVEGEAVARGILRYLNTADPGSGFVEPYPRPDPPPSPGGVGGRPCADPAL